jgi:segregation and condensation protein B
MAPPPPDELAVDVRGEARRAIEAIVLVTEEPIDTGLLGQLLELRPALVEELCHELAAEYAEQGRGFQLVRVAGGWRFQTHPDQAPYIERFVLEGQHAKLSAAALETLAIVAYKQPISRAQVASIRGVSVDGVMRTLQQRGYIAEVGRDPGPGQAVMFGTTPAFLEKLGLDRIDELPALGAFVPGADVVEQLERGLRPDARPAPDMADLVPGSGDGDGHLPDTGVHDGLDADSDADFDADDGGPDGGE